MGMSVIVAAARESDAEQIFRLQYLCFQSEAERYGNYRIEALVESLDSVRASVGRDCVFVARLGDEVVGAVTGTVGEDGTARIGKLCVHPRLQRHGLGARLLLAVEAGPDHRAGRQPAEAAHRSPQRPQPPPLPARRIRGGGGHHGRRRPADRAGEGRAHRAGVRRQRLTAAGPPRTRGRPASGEETGRPAAVARGTQARGRRSHRMPVTGRITGMKR